MAIYTPYFYIIQDVRNGMYYAGAKWAQDANPATFMIEGGYTTSSETINELISTYGLDKFIIRKIRTFETAEETQKYETRFLRRIDTRKNPSFYNAHNNDGAMDHQKIKLIIKELYGVDNISQSEYWKEIVPPKLRRPKTDAHKKALVEAHKNPETKKKHSENMKRTRASQSKAKKKEIGTLGGKSGKGNLWWNNGEISIKSRFPPEDKKWIQGRLIDWEIKGSKEQKPTVTCPICNKSGGKPVMIRFHFDNCKQINR